MKVEVFRCYTYKNIPKNAKIVYDNSGKKRPAWVWVKGLPDDVAFIRLRVNGLRLLYQIYISTDMPVFMPLDRTKEETKKFYNKFSKMYNEEVKKRNFKAAKFLLKNIKLQKDAKILDLGTGSGLSSLFLARKGYENITLFDYSKNMLSLAKKRRELKNCNFIQGDVRKLKLEKKFDMILSVFSFASNSYLEEAEMPRLWKKVTKQLKQNGFLALMGYDYEPPKSLFKKIKNGKFRIIKDFQAKWYIGRKK